MAWVRFPDLRHMWAEFVIGSLLAFSEVFGYPHTIKANKFDYNSSWKQWTRRITSSRVHCQTPIVVIIIFIIFLKVLTSIKDSIIITLYISSLSYAYFLP